MNNTINACDNNISFNARYLRIKKRVTVPDDICDAIYKNEAVDKFLKAGTPKTWWEKLKDLFRKDEFLDVVYERTSMSSFDPFHIRESVRFVFRNKESKPLIATQNGVRREFGCIAKEGEHRTLKAPDETATNKLVKLIEDIKDLTPLLK